MSIIYVKWRKVMVNQNLDYLQFVHSVIQDQRRLTQYKKVVYRQKVVRGYEGRPSWKHLDGLSTLREFSEQIYVQKLIIRVMFYYFEVWAKSLFIIVIFH